MILLEAVPVTETVGNTVGSAATLRADLGYAVLKEDYDNTEIFRFGAGKQF